MPKGTDGPGRLAGRLLAGPFRATTQVLRFAMQTFEHLLARATWGRLLVVLLALLAAWHIYVPVHELLHVAACRLTGGTVGELALKPRYGAYLLQPLFPFIVPESDFAGQLTRFEVPNDWAYALVDLAPYTLSLFGVTLLVAARRRSSVVLFVTGLILAVAPLMAIPGDFYELTSLLLTRMGALMDSSQPVRALVTDDPPALVRRLAEAGRLTPRIWVLVGAGFVLSTYLAAGFLAVQVKISNWFDARSVRG